MRGNYFKTKEIEINSNHFNKDDIFEEFKLVRNILLSDKKFNRKKATINFYYIFKDKISYNRYLDLILNNDFDTFYSHLTKDKKCNKLSFKRTLSMNVYKEDMSNSNKNALIEDFVNILYRYINSL